MEDALRSIMILQKKHLLSNDATIRKSAVLEIKQSLKTMESDTVVKIVLDLNMPSLLLHLLLKSDFSDNPDILECIELLCSNKIYFQQDQAVPTANAMLRNVFASRKTEIYDRVLVQSLEIIITIIENLDDYNSKINLEFTQFLNAIRKFLTLKNDPLIIYTTVKMFGALVLHKKFQKIMNDELIKKVESLSDLSLEKLEQIFVIDERYAIAGVSKLCDSMLRLLIEINIFVKNKIDGMLEKMQIISYNCLKLVCIPYIAEYCKTSDDMCLEYLFFLKTFLISHSCKNTVNSISVQLVKDHNFLAIAKYLGKLNNIFDREEPDTKRQLCLMILCEIIININKVCCSLYSGEKCKKNLFKCLKNVLDINVNDWIIFLSDSRFDIDTKCSIVQFCTVYYIHSNNRRELRFEHLKSLIDFLEHLPVSENLNIYILKDLWLLFAVSFHMFFRQISNDSPLYKATITLWRLVSVHKNSFKKVISYHPSIIYEVFINPFVDKNLIYLVTNCWLLHSVNYPSLHRDLLQIIYIFPKAAQILLETLQSDSSVHATAAARILQTALKLRILADNEDFSRHLFTAVPATIKHLNHGNIFDVKVKACIYLMNFSSLIDTPCNHYILYCSINFVVTTIGFLGSNKLPPLFYTSVFKYVNKILTVATANKTAGVFLTLMNSKPMLFTIQEALVSNDQEMSVQASQLFSNLLEFQTHCRFYCKTTVILNKEFLKKMLCVQGAQLELNLKILEMILFTTGNTVLKLEIDSEFAKGLYYRCLNLVFKPGAHSFSKFALKCLEGLLRYVKINKFESLDYLLQHSGNHNMLVLYFDPVTSRIVDRAFLSFIQCWLQFAVAKKENILNKIFIGYKYWKITLNQITDIIIEDKIQIEPNNSDLINSIIRQLIQLFELLPAAKVNYLRKIEENV